MGKRKPKLQPLTDDQEEAVQMTAHHFFGEAVSYANDLHAYYGGRLKTKPKPPKDLDTGIVQATVEWLDTIGLRAEEVVMEPYDQADHAAA